MNLQDWIDLVESRIPPFTAEKWDPVGLLTGSRKQKITGAVIATDLSGQVLARAKQEKKNLIVIHHPPLFPKNKGITQFADVKEGSLTELVLRARDEKIAVYVAHTNFDRCAIDGMAHLAQHLGFEPRSRLWDTSEPTQGVFKKLVTYVPTTHLDQVRATLFEIGCGQVGNYDECGFVLEGEGSFRALHGASPFLGKVGQREFVREQRFETVFLGAMERFVVAALKAAHPYEEVAYDIFSLDRAPQKGSFLWGFGYGFVGRLAGKSPLSRTQFLSRVAKYFKVHHAIVNGNLPARISTVAYSPGKGTSFVSSAIDHGVDVFITGEVGYHAALELARAGIAVMELGHRESEQPFLQTWSQWMKEWELPSSVLDIRAQEFMKF